MLFTQLEKGFLQKFIFWVENVVKVFQPSGYLKPLSIGERSGERLEVKKYFMPNYSVPTELLHSIHENQSLHAFILEVDLFELI